MTYPFGRDVALPGLRIYRCPKPPFLRRVRIGPSAAKIVLDVLLAFTAARLAHVGRYDAVHSHEEAAVPGLWLAEWLGVPHLYDMHSSLPQQLHNFGYDRSALVRRLFERAEAAMITRSRAIITICQELQDTAVALGAADRASLIENVMGGDVDGGATPSVDELRARYGLEPGQPLMLYTGTFEAYQGLDLLIEAAAILERTHPDARVLVVGGTPEQVARAVASAADGAGGNPIFAGQRPATEIPGFLAACDIVVSPRTSGTNTPLKIYSYLRAGRPIVATRLRTHTQVLDPDTALLVAPRADALAAGLARLIDDPGERARWLSPQRERLHPPAKRIRNRPNCAATLDSWISPAPAVRGSALPTTPDLPIARGEFLSRRVTGSLRAFCPCLPPRRGRGVSGHCRRATTTGPTSPQSVRSRGLR